MKKILSIILCTFLLVIISYFTFEHFFNKNDVNKNKENSNNIKSDKTSNISTDNDECEEILKISDKSRNCFSNVLVVCKNNKYQVIKGAYQEGSDPVIQKGNYNYDIDKLIGELKNYPADEHNLNYSVTLKDGTSYRVSIIDSKEVNNFLSSITDKNILWCD